MAKACILVVEDDVIIARNIQMELTSLGYAVPAVTGSGGEALQRAAEMQPDLVLMDISLKGDMDGVETVERLQEQFDIPVVYLTAFADDHTLQRAKRTEPYGYLIKPYEEQELHTTVQLALYKHKMDGMLKENQRWLATVLRCIGDGVMTTDARGCTTTINPVAERLTGWRQEEALGHDLRDVFQIYDDQERAPLPNPATRALQKGVAVALPDHALLAARDGRETPVEGSVAPILDDRGNFTGFVLVFRDITERKRAEEVLHQSAEDLG